VSSTIRKATEGDLAALVDIYNHYVLETPVTFDTQAFTPDTRASWFQQFAADGPYRLLVAERHGDVIAYASSVRFKDKPAYATSVETSIYVHPGQTGQGLGERLYRALLDELSREPGLHRAYGGVTVPNPASVALHEKLGYRKAATYSEVGHKFGRYWDVCWFERALTR
jgi:phosphinothricin acetyltransferase